MDLSPHKQRGPEDHTRRGQRQHCLTSLFALDWAAPDPRTHHTLARQLRDPRNTRPHYHMAAPAVSPGTDRVPAQQSHLELEQAPVSTLRLVKGVEGAGVRIMTPHK